MAQGLIERDAVPHGRGRPKHRYRLTPKGVRVTGSNFADLALALWREIGSITNLELRRQMISQVIQAMASGYARQIEGRTTAERMRSIRRLLAERRLPFSVEGSDELPILTAHACPYPELAEEDRSVCTFEKLLYAELLGRNLELFRCRLDGDGSCQFRPA
jgi:predicted ArsR family transcriptional regulator